MSKLKDYRQQRVNANRHKPFGMKLITDSVQRDGFSAPMVAAADGELFIGSARKEVVDDVMDVDPIIVHSKGDRPIIHVRDDILTADDPRARRLGYADNAIASIDWNPDGAILAALAADDNVIQHMIAADNASTRAVMGFAEDGKEGNEQNRKLEPQQMLHILISVNVNDAIYVRNLVEQIATMRGVEVDYSAN